MQFSFFDLRMLFSPSYLFYRELKQMIVDGFVFPGKESEKMKIFRKNTIQTDFEDSREIYEHNKNLQDTLKILQEQLDNEFKKVKDLEGKLGHEQSSLKLVQQSCDLALKENDEIKVIVQYIYKIYITLQMFTGIYGVFAGKSGCRDFRIAGFTCTSAFSINSVGLPFMDFAGKVYVQNLYAIQ